MFSLEWAHVIFAGAGVAIGGVTGLVAGVWRVAHIEQDIRKDFTQEIAEATHELGLKIDEATDRFDETLKGLRQKINDVELGTERNFRNFVDKKDFDNLRDEWREDMRDLKNNISEMLKAKA